MDCENCRLLTVVGPHDTGPWSGWTEMVPDLPGWTAIHAVSSVLFPSGDGSGSRQNEDSRLHYRNGDYVSGHHSSKLFLSFSFASCLFYSLSFVRYSPFLTFLFANAFLSFFSCCSLFLLFCASLILLLSLLPFFSPSYLVNRSLIHRAGVSFLPSSPLHQRPAAAAPTTARTVAN